MKIQITRFSTHQTAKVFAILMFFTSLIFMTPFMLLSTFGASAEQPGQGVMASMFLFMPILQGILGYLMVRLGLWLYNKIVGRIGGIEFEYQAVETQESA